MALTLRPNCEYCDKDLPPDSRNANICTFECTFCDACVEQLKNVCPNCGGNFERRPIRPVLEHRPGVSLRQRPASAERVHLSYDKDDIAALSNKLSGVPPEDR